MSGEPREGESNGIIPIVENEKGKEQERQSHPLEIKLKKIQSNTQDKARRWDLLLKRSDASTELTSNERHIVENQHALQLSEDTSSQLLSELVEIDERIRNLHDEYNSIQVQEDILGQLKGPKKFLSSGKRIQLEKEKAEILKKTKELQDLEIIKTKQRRALEFPKEEVKKQQSETIKEELKKDVDHIRQQYMEFAQEVLQDKPFMHEIKKQFIKAVLKPKIDNLIQKKNLSVEEAEEFYNFLDLFPEGSEQQWKEAYPNKFKDMFRVEVDREGHPGSSDIIQSDVEIWMNKDYFEQMVIRFIAETGYNDANLLLQEINQKTGENFSVKNVRSYQYDVNEGNVNVTSKNISKMDLCAGKLDWLSIKTLPAFQSSNQVREIFGDLIQKKNDDFYRQLRSELQKQHIQDEFISAISLYPTPENIRDLIIIAASDPVGNEVSAANETLLNLANRIDWLDVLDQAVKKYPGLQPLRPILETWNFLGGGHPNIKNFMNNIALPTIQDPDISKDFIKHYVLQSLPLNGLLNFAVQKGYINEYNFESLLEAEIIMRTLRQSETYQEADNNFDFMLRGVLISCINEENSVLLEERKTLIKDLARLAGIIVCNKDDKSNLHFFTSVNITRFFQKRDSIMFNQSHKNDDKPLTMEQKEWIFKATELCPRAGLEEGFQVRFLISKYPEYFLHEKGLRFLQKLDEAYSTFGGDVNLEVIMKMVFDKKLSEDRALELPTKAKEILVSSSNFFTAVEFPELFFGTDEGIDFFNHIASTGLFSVNKELDIKIGEMIRNLKLQFPELLEKIALYEIKQIEALLSSDSSIEINQQNWKILLMGYARSQAAGIFNIPRLSQASIEKINILFDDPKARDVCLNELRGAWLEYVKSGKPDKLPFSLHFLSEFINYCGGAGQLSQIESLNSLISAVNETFTRKTTAERTKQEICQETIIMEERFEKERWSNEDRTDFYNISQDIIKAAPSLFADYLHLFSKLTPSQLKSFAKNIYPLYRTKLVLMEEKDAVSGSSMYGKEQLIHIRNDIKALTNVLYVANGENVFEKQKQKLLDEIKNLFKDRFGIVKIPSEFNTDHIRSITNVSLYLANMAKRNAQKETILGFYLSLMVNNKWDDFRKGEMINPSEYMTLKKDNVILISSRIIADLLERRKTLSPLTSENLGISQEEIPEFIKILQQEEQSMVIGNIETIDAKLTNIILNLKGLEDLDLYPELLDKRRMKLLLEWGNKKVGSAIAKMYQALASPGKSIPFSQEESEIQRQVVQIIEELSLTLTPQTLKEHFQDGIKPLATVANMLNFIGEVGAEPEIDALRKLLRPSQEISNIFQRLGEDFKPTSGALALSQDLNYLDNLIVKREDELQPQEKELLKEYISSIRAEIIKLEGIYEQVKNKFGSLKKGNIHSSNPLFQDKLRQIDAIINTQITQQVITSTITNNLNVIMENIRECLSCARQGSNNDTNLTFGDLNKFFLYTQSETQKKGSISDQVLFLEPIILTDGSSEMAFIFDRTYGVNTPTILDNHIEVVLKKYRTIKQRFPHVKLSVFISDSAITTGGTSVDMLLENMKMKGLSVEKETVKANVVESAMGDHYIEFGGEARNAGIREISGLRLSA